MPWKAHSAWCAAGATGLVLALGGAIGVARNEQVWLKALFVLVTLSGLFCLVTGWRSTRGRAGTRTPVR